MNSFKDKFQIAKVLASLFTHSATPEEERTYRTWLDESPEHIEIADRILKKETYEKNKLLIDSFPSQQAWERIYPMLGEEKTSGRFLWKKFLKYAALILLLVIPASYLIYTWVAEEPIDVIAPGVSGGEVLLSDGKILRIPNGARPEGAAEVFVINAKGINYHTSENKPLVRETKNVLRTLQGMECSIILSDGTNVHLNAETKLTYPVCFSGKERIVQIEGEAYFDVATDKEHPFVVKTPHSSVQVTGTSFNVRAYPDEPTECITLTSGSITIDKGNKEFALTPGQHFIFDKSTGKDSVTDVNTELYTSWQSGSFVFMNVPLEDIMSYLSKWYGCNYVFNDEAAKKVRIGAYLNRYENMNPIIDMIKGLNHVDIRQQDGILHISYKQ